MTVYHGLRGGSTSSSAPEVQGKRKGGRWKSTRMRKKFLWPHHSERSIVDILGFLLVFSLHLQKMALSFSLTPRL